MDKLKPCPFCGGDGTSGLNLMDGPKFIAQCFSCYAFVGGETEQEAIALWNNRPQTWIPVIERLPEECGEYLCHGEYGFEVCELNSLKLFVNFNCDIVQHIKAWQPLPEPYDHNG